LILTCLSIASGIIMLAIYSWNLNRFFKVYTTWEICEFYAPGLLIDPDSCNKFFYISYIINLTNILINLKTGKSLVTLHGLMIALGICAIILNSAILISTCRRPINTSKPKYFYKSDPLTPKTRSTLI